MRRYLFDSETIKKADIYDFDAVVVGSGIAGLYAALHLDSRMQCAVITKANIEESNSYLAQGGIAAVLTEDDTYIAHIEDTLKAGAGLCDPEAVKVLVEEGPENIKTLIDMKIPFDVNSEGDLHITREGGHRVRRIVHCGGDATGKETTKQLGRLASQKDNLHFFMESYLVDVLTEGNSVCGVVCFIGEEYKIFRTSNVILATGGCGQIYAYTTNPLGAVGDGISVAQRAGAVLHNMEMVQFHPTTLISNENTSRLFLISEAVRGEGAILKNEADEAFMKGKHEMADLAPRDIVTREILKELDRTGTDKAYLDCSAMTKEFFSARFPTIFSECAKRGINIPEDYIPIHPAQHYLMGGVRTNLDGMTNIDGLYCCGEAAESGIHGGNRLASNSLLECLVFGRRAAFSINNSNRPSRSINLPSTLQTDFGNELTNEELDVYYKTIKETMSKYVGAVRTPNGLKTALEIIKEIYSHFENAHLVKQYDYKVYNMCQMALEVINSAINRKESVGAHYIVEDKQ